MERDGVRREDVGSWEEDGREKAREGERGREGGWGLRRKRRTRRREAGVGGCTPAACQLHDYDYD